jgi:hypothetical protein
MDLVAHPLVVEGELLFQFIDNARADIAVRSYVVREDPDGDRVGHDAPSFGGYRETTDTIPASGPLQSTVKNVDNRPERSALGCPSTSL